MIVDALHYCLSQETNFKVVKWRFLYGNVLFLMGEGLFSMGGVFLDVPFVGVYLLYSFCLCISFSRNVRFLSYFWVLMCNGNGSLWDVIISYYVCGLLRGWVSWAVGFCLYVL